MKSLIIYICIVYICSVCVFCEMKFVPRDDDVAWPKHVDDRVQYDLFPLIFCFNGCIYYTYLFSLCSTASNSEYVVSV